MTAQSQHLLMIIPRSGASQWHQHDKRRLLQKVRASFLPLPLGDYSPQFRSDSRFLVREGAILEVSTVIYDGTNLVCEMAGVKADNI